MSKWELTKAFFEGARDGATEAMNKAYAKTYYAWANSDIGALARGDFQGFWEIQKNSSIGQLLQGNFSQAANQFKLENRNIENALRINYVKNGFREIGQAMENAVDDGDDNKLSSMEKTVAVVEMTGTVADEMTTPAVIASLFVFGEVIKGGQILLNKLPTIVGKVVKIGLIADGTRRVGRGTYDIGVAKTKEEVENGTDKVVGGLCEASIGFNVKTAKTSIRNSRAIESLRVKLNSSDAPRIKILAERLNKKNVTREDITAIKREEKLELVLKEKCLIIWLVAVKLK